jgi:hypothetical protein
MNYTLSLSSDNVTGPFTANFNTTAGLMTTVQLNKLTPGAATSVNVSFGDGSSVVISNLNSSSPLFNVSHNYTQVGKFYIVATPIGLNTSYTVVNNNMTVNVAAAPIYTCK